MVSFLENLSILYFSMAGNYSREGSSSMPGWFLHCCALRKDTLASQQVFFLTAVVMMKIQCTGGALSTTKWVLTRSTGTTRKNRSIEVELNKLHTQGGSFYKGALGSGTKFCFNKWRTRVDWSRGGSPSNKQFHASKQKILWSQTCAIK